MRSPFKNSIMKKILFILSAILLFAACDDSKESTPVPQTSVSAEILGYWVFTETYMGSVYTESLHFYDTGEFTHYGDETDWLGNEGHYLYNPGRGTLQLLYNASGELNNYLISIAGTQMTLRYIDEEDGPEEPMIFTRMGE